MENEPDYGDYNLESRSSEKYDPKKVRIIGRWRNLREENIRMVEVLGNKVEGHFDELGEWYPGIEK